jgi:hypothetical protein
MSLLLPCSYELRQRQPVAPRPSSLTGTSCRPSNFHDDCCLDVPAFGRCPCFMACSSPFTNGSSKRSESRRDKSRRGDGSAIVQDCVQTSYADGFSERNRHSNGSYAMRAVNRSCELRGVRAMVDDSSSGLAASMASRFFLQRHHSGSLAAPASWRVTQQIAIWPRCRRGAVVEQCRVWRRILP